MKITRLKTVCVILSAIFLCSLSSSCSKEAYGTAYTDNEETRIPKSVKPLIDYWMRDTYIMSADDGYYYMVGTTADPTREFTGQTHCWDWNDGIYLFRSNDLKQWDSLGCVWSIEKDGTWQSHPKVFANDEKRPLKSLNGDPLDNRYQAVWAPELHYNHSLETWFLVACMNNSEVGKGSFILRSTSGKPEGPYVNIKGNDTKPIFDNIDGSLFEDEDGQMYFVAHNHFIAKMKPDMSDLAEPIHRIAEREYSPEPYIEGAYIFKYDGKYHLIQAIWSHRTDLGDTYCPAVDDNATRYSYDCVVATADNIEGPYGERYNVITGGGHNNLFKDKDGNLWATIFFNPRGAMAQEFEKTCRPAIVPIKYSKGRFSVNNRL